MKHWIHSVSRKLVGAVLVLAVMTALPTGWLYDLWAGTGAEQGKQPSGDVQQLQRQEEIETCFLSNAPVTVAGGELAPCPLARLRDVGQEGTHYHHNGGTKRSVYVSEYITADYPLSAWEYVLQRVAAGGFYNRYYLMELGDNSWLCVYFDDYLTLTGTDTYPTGYVRYTTTEERRMLNRMAEDYDVNPAYVLDMYQHGKMSGNTDLLLRFAVAFLGTCAICLLLDRLKSCLKAQK